MSALGKESSDEGAEERCLEGDEDFDEGWSTRENWKFREVGGVLVFRFFTWLMS